MPGVSPETFAHRLERVWEAMGEHDYHALVVAGRGIVGQNGFLEWLTGYCPVIRHAYAVVRPAQRPLLVVPTTADAWYARRWTSADDAVVAG